MSSTQNDGSAAATAERDQTQRTQMQLPNESSTLLAPQPPKRKRPPSLDRDRLANYPRDRARQGFDSRSQDNSPRLNTGAPASSVGRLSGQSLQTPSTARENYTSTTPTGFISPLPGRLGPNQPTAASRGNSQSTTPTDFISPLPGRQNQAAATSRGDNQSTTPTGPLQPNKSNQAPVTPRQNISTPDPRTPPSHNFTINTWSARRRAEEEQLSPTPPPPSSRERRTRPRGHGTPGSRGYHTPSRTLRGNDAAPTSNWQRSIQEEGENNLNTMDVTVDEDGNEDEEMDIDC